jgi:hypothetical protein
MTMIKKVLTKAVAGTAAAGLLMLPAVGTVAPQIANVACQYPDSVSTSMNIDVAKSVVRQGEKNSATIVVRSGAGVPKGNVTFEIQGVNKVRNKNLVNGRATFDIPQLKAGRTYGIDSQFRGSCQYRNSSDTAYVTVVKKR